MELITYRQILLSRFVEAGPISYHRAAEHAYIIRFPSSIPAPDNTSRGCCCRNSRPTVINPDYNMTKQRYITRVYDKIRSKSPPNRTTSPTCLHCDVTHLPLTTGVVALHIPSRKVGVREEYRQARKTVWPVNAGRVICRYENNLCGIINHYKHIWECFCDV